MDDNLCFSVPVDAPRFYRFNHGSPGNADTWFNTKKPDFNSSSDEEVLPDAEPTPDNKSAQEEKQHSVGPLSAIHNSDKAPGAGHKLKGGSSQSSGIPASGIPQVMENKRPRNVVTSWDHRQDVEKVDAHQADLGNRMKRCGNPPNPLEQPPRKCPRLNKRVTQRKKDALTTDELAMMKAQEEAAAAAAKRKDQAARLKKILQRKRHVTPKSVKPLTMPCEFSFRTSERIRPTTQHGMDVEESQGKGEAFYQPLASRVQDFDKIPDRFKPLPPGAQVPVFPPRQELTLTVPKGPNLHTARRMRGSKPQAACDPENDKNSQKIAPKATTMRKRKCPEDGFKDTGR